VQPRPPIAWAWIAGPLLVVLAAHLAVLGRYGFGWDELYYVACADHLAWGYVDHPPLIAFVTAATRFLLGDSLPALRLPNVLAGLLAALERASSSCPTSTALLRSGRC
jgi:4-amino-4-deoxy-L-arabinose transferase-like glycosyltransferase